LAMARLVWSGLMATYDLAVITHQLGGMVPFYGERIEMFDEIWRSYPEVYPQQHRPFDTGLKAQFQRFYADIAIHGSEPSLAAGYDFFGPERLVFGVDYPFGPDNGRKLYEVTVPAVEAMDIAQSDKDRIFSGNLTELLG
ncbi:MAG: amidohydrolase family protein, partial [Halobacteriales archaeon]|nr:amidohydrolase family protein [Halobacteriales archaeon]